MGFNYEGASDDHWVYQNQASVMFFCLFQQKKDLAE